MNNIGIIGCGTMGLGIAEVFARAGKTVTVYDQHSAVLSDASKRLPEITFTDDLTDLSESELVIEAIVENLEAKKKLFIDIEYQVTPDCILATNTSSLSITSIAGTCRHPERVIGLHFFNPASVMDLVEIIPATQTEVGLASEMRNLIVNVGKVPVVAKDTPGFIVNRLARPFYGEAIRILEEGIAAPQVIDHAMKTLGGFRMGPFQLMDFIGHDVNFQVTNTIFEAFFYDPRYKPSFTQKRLVEAGYLGRKTGRGFYKYDQDAKEVAKQYLMQNPPSDALLEQIYRRILVMLINEAADALALNIATREDLDYAMMKGVNYPKGLLQWADEWGIPKVVAELDDLYNYYHEDRYRVSPKLRALLAEDKGFYSK